MMNHRHLTLNERGQVQDIADLAGLVPLLRILGAYVEANHPDDREGRQIRTALAKIAARIDDYGTPSSAWVDQDERD